MALGAATNKPKSLIRTLRVALKGKALLTSPRFNKGTAFSHDERIAFSLQGRLPYRPNTLEKQCQRAYEQLKRREWDRPDSGYKKREEMTEREMERADEETNLRKNTFLQSLKDQNWTLYYALLARHLKELVPVIYTPTQADAIQNYSHLLRRSEGLYLSYPERDDMERIFLEKTHGRDIELIVVTDSEAILGIGDQGVGGVGISTAKSALYTLVGGIDPGKTLSVVLDVGTDNEELLNDPLYVGWPERRLRGQQYDDFVDKFVQLVRKYYPHTLLHFEDFASKNAMKLLEKYRHSHAVFNDDIQGTGAVTLSFLLSAINVASKTLDAALSKALQSSQSAVSFKQSSSNAGPLSSQRYVVLGFGAAGSGITRQLRDAMASGEGISSEEAMRKFWIVDRDGLLYQDHQESGQTEKEKPELGMESKDEWARPASEGWGSASPQLPKVSRSTQHVSSTKDESEGGGKETSKATSTGVDADDGIEYDGKLGGGSVPYVGEGLNGRPDLSIEWEGIDPFIEAEKPGDLLKSGRKLSGRDESQRKSQGRHRSRVTKKETESASTSSKRKVALLEVIQRVRPTVLIGCSTSAGAFAEEIIRAMVDGLHYEASEKLDDSTRGELAKKSITGRVEGPMPIILPLSNPKRLAEAKPKDLLRWTDGRALVATGSPFGMVKMKVGDREREFKIAECNNALIYPGLGLGTILSHSRSITDTMILAGAQRLAELSDAMKAINESTPDQPFEYSGQALLPDFADAPRVNFEVAIAVCEQSIREDTAGRMWYRPNLGSRGSKLGASYSEAVPSARATRLKNAGGEGEGVEEERSATGPPPVKTREEGKEVSETREMALREVRDEAKRRVWVPVYCDYEYDEKGLIE
ncbi:hypothetical protein BJ165DRAFT_429472 [Panaeolus papilionaceus]|nr:hypothetical protein BJ165DRAFT_429472 [Panaeolus papilionaceus]